MSNKAVPLPQETSGLELRLLARTALAYLPGRIVPVVAGAIALPALGWLLTPADFGTVSIVSAALSYFAVVAGDWIVAGYQRSAHLGDPYEEAQAVTWVLVLASVSAILLGVAGAFTEQIEFFALALLLVPYLVMRTQWIKLQMTGRAWYYSGIQAGYALVRAVAMLAAAAYAHSVDFVLGGWILVGFLVVLLGPRLRFGRVPRFANLRELARIGTPLITVAVALNLMANADRFVIDLFYGRAEAGVYSFGYMIGESILRVPSSVIYLAGFWLATRFWDDGREEDALQLIATLMRRQVVLSVIIVFALTLCSGPAFALFVPSAYQASAPVVGVIAAAQILAGISQYLVLIATLRRQTRSTITPSIMAAILNVVLTTIAVLAFGLIGAAIATFASCALYCGWLFGVVHHAVLNTKTAAGASVAVVSAGSAALTPNMLATVLASLATAAGLAFMLIGSKSPVRVRRPQ